MNDVIVAKEPDSRFTSSSLRTTIRCSDQVYSTTGSNSSKSNPTWSDGVNGYVVQTILGPSDQLESQKEEPDAHR